MIAGHKLRLPKFYVPLRLSCFYLSVFPTPQALVRIIIGPLFRRPFRGMARFVARLGPLRGIPSGIRSTNFIEIN